MLAARARCTATKLPFGIRFEQSAKGIWWACSAFPLSERQARESRILKQSNSFVRGVSELPEDVLTAVQIREDSSRGSQ